MFNIYSHIHFLIVVPLRCYLILAGAFFLLVLAVPRHHLVDLLYQFFAMLKDALVVRLLLVTELREAMCKWCFVRGRGQI